jgi:hypothetical protein
MSARSTICLIAALGAAAFGMAGTNAVAAASQIVLPADKDEYSALVARAATGDQSVDFRALRFAFLKSAARRRMGGRWGTADLQKELFAAMDAGDAQRVRDLAEKIISADYTNMWGHKGLRQACEKLNDAVCAEREHFVEFGLLTSITHSGDGKTCKTGWEVATVAEEYFVLAMMGVRMQQQALIGGAPSCDAMTVTDQNGATVTYFFRIDAVLADEAGMLSGGQ